MQENAKTLPLRRGVLCSWRPLSEKVSSAACSEVPKLKLIYIFSNYIEVCCQRAMGFFKWVIVQHAENPMQHLPGTLVSLNCFLGKRMQLSSSLHPPFSFTEEAEEPLGLLCLDLIWLCAHVCVCVCVFNKCGNGDYNLCSNLSCCHALNGLTV